MEVEKRRNVPKLIRLRIWLGMLHLVAILACALSRMTFEPVDDRIVFELGDGLARAWILPSSLGQWLLLALVMTELSWYLFVTVACFLLSRQEDSRSSSMHETSSAAVSIVLRWLGANDRIINGIVETLLMLLTDVDLVASDVAFGILLVAKRQNQLLSKQQDSDSHHVLQGQQVDERRRYDSEVMADFHRYIIFAMGIYGLEVQIIGEAARDGTYIVLPHRFVGACCRATPCAQHKCCGGPSPQTQWCSWPCCPRQGTVEGDNCCLRHSYALWRALSKLPGGTDHIELLWGTWENNGLESAPPFAVFADHASRELIITVRGTLSIKDVVVDISCKPVPFDIWMPEDAAGEEACDSPTYEKSEFYAHAGFLACMRDLKSRLTEQGILEQLSSPWGKAHQYRVMCTGHSLGAGVALLLALDLRQHFGDAVRFVGFEPPGCVVCPRLAQVVERLGWCSLVIFHDWVPRVSLRSLQELREEVIDELFTCPDSKLRIAMSLPQAVIPILRPCLVSMCLRSCRYPLGVMACVSSCLMRFCSGLSRLCPLASAVRRCFAAHYFVRCSWSRQPRASEDLTELAAVEDGRVAAASRCTPAGGHLLSDAEALHRARRLRRADPNFYADQMCCPGRLVILRPRESQQVCGVFWRDTRWEAAWGRLEEITGIVLASRAVEYHFPFIVASALRNIDGAASVSKDTARSSSFASASAGVGLSRQQSPVSRTSTFFSCSSSSFEHEREFTRTASVPPASVCMT
eukprot:TRINITY_DN28831_c0_g1_i1.p1 TRINITY_DN28831_c0_g1~~TRINITY_DN28831_c0_g1_i1.p1  ORF type:complete len:847 (+),score=48.47 TRINITY_DN28831_c0_g1_i1:297-2543(+)